MEQNVNEQIETIRKRVLDKDNLSRDLHIMRVPIKTFQIFKEKSADFAGDYGMLLKWMVDKLFVENRPIEEIVAVINEEVIPSINILAAKIDEIESSMLNQSKTRTRVSINKRKETVWNGKE